MWNSFSHSEDFKKIFMPTEMSNSQPRICFVDQYNLQGVCLQVSPLKKHQIRTHNIIARKMQAPVKNSSSSLGNKIRYFHEKFKIFSRCSSTDISFNSSYYLCNYIGVHVFQK